MTVPPSELLDFLERVVAFSLDYEHPPERIQNLLSIIETTLKRLVKIAKQGSK